ncbi:MFS transporter small subunit [Tautonia rosea]|uniref:MFS transporter small subunit n=1 Tax=Tautonia rosea TaxID=2728037 RepID=UPI0014767B98|nr:hypothetical protein [Tautonia rosea]
MPENASGRSSLRLVIYWAFVLVPLGWGISRSVVTSLPLLASTDAPITSSTEE